MVVIKRNEMKSEKITHTHTYTQINFFNFYHEQKAIGVHETKLGKSKDIMIQSHNDQNRYAIRGTERASERTKKRNR